jgi:TPR repeat protein
MRISSIAACAVVLSVFGLTGQSMGFDADQSKVAAPLSPLEAFRSGAKALETGDTAKALTSLQYAAENGHALAQWQLGRMYALGKGVPHDDLRAFEYFKSVIKGHLDDSPSQPQGRVVSSAFVALGEYYLTGIPHSAVTANPARARDMFGYAASYFGDPDAQYQLGKLYLEGGAVKRETKLALRWLALAANKGHHQAQALLGRVLFKGHIVPQQRPLGLMWLTLACDGPGAKIPGVVDQRDAAFQQATEDERQVALTLLEGWLNGRRDW